MKLSQLTETPQLIPRLDPFDRDEGIQACLSLVNKATQVEKYDDDAGMYHAKEGVNSYYFIYNSAASGKDRIEYFVRYHELTFDKSLVPSKAARQVLLWRNRHSAYSGNAAKDIFWDKLFKQYGCLASDSTQSEDGKKFWVTAVGVALKQGLQVRIINTESKKFVDVKTIAEFNKEVDKTWGTTQWFRRMVVVIFRPSESIH